MAESTADLVSRLFVDPPYPGVYRVRGEKQTVLSLLKVLEGRPDALVYVMNMAGFFTDKDADIRDATCVTIDAILGSAGNEALHRFLACTASSGSHIPYQWYDLKPEHLSGLCRVKSVLPSVMGLLTYHCNGYVRHEALRELAQIHDGRELPYILLSLNDWVEPICHDAAQLIRDRMTPEYEAHFLANLTIALSLFRLKRRDHSKFIDFFLNLLLEPRNEAYLKDSLRWRGRDVRRQVMHRSLELGSQRAFKVIEYGLESSDVSLRLAALKDIRRHLTGELLRECLQPLKRDPFMPLRREAMLIEAEQFPESAAELWTSALFDRNASLRALAQIRIRNMPGRSPAIEYRKALAAVPESPFALFGLGECGEKSDVPLIRSGLTSPLTSVRRASVFGIGRLGGEEEVPTLMKMLRDPSPGVVREATRQLERWPQHLVPEELLSAFEENVQLHLRRAVLSLFAGLGRWEGLIWLIRAATSAAPDQPIADEAWRLIEHRLSISRSNRDFTRPTEKQRTELLALARDTSLSGEIGRQILREIQ